MPLGAKLLARAHPRACGENHADIFKGVCEIGSSPRMRGKLTGITAPRLRCRLIPAHAGKTGSTDPSVGLDWAHPRACGENSEYEVFGISERGSSPRMRGKLRRVLGFFFRGRLIPAHAGKTFACMRSGRLNAAHPRACGENIRDGRKQGRGEGSSPRMRGKLLVSVDESGLAGLIPAHAGKTESECEKA